MKKAGLVAILVVSVIVTVYGVDYFSAMRSYEKLRAGADSPLMQSMSIGQREQEFLDEVQNSWVLRESVWPDDTLREMCELTGFEPTVEGLVSLYTYEVPPFSIFDKEQNLKEAGRAGALSAFKPRTTDDTIYFKQGVAYMRVHADILDYYEDTDLGLRRIIYTRTKKPNKAEMATPRKPSDQF